GDEGPCGRGVRAERHQEDGRRRRPCREAPDPGHDRLSAAQGALRERRRGGRAGHRHLSRQPSLEPGREGGAGAAGGREMIGKLKGLVDAIGESHCIIDVNGVGYEVQASARALRTMEIGQSVTLVIDTHVREDAIRLFGFTSEVERSWFRTLQAVQGVGAKVALAVLGTLSSQELANAIALGDWASLERSPGVGKRLAQRITTELKDKAPALAVAGLNAPAVRAGGSKGE